MAGSAALSPPCLQVAAASGASPGQGLPPADGPAGMGQVVLPAGVPRCLRSPLRQGGSGTPAPSGRVFGHYALRRDLECSGCVGSVAPAGKLVNARHSSEVMNQNVNRLWAEYEVFAAYASAAA